LYHLQHTEDDTDNDIDNLQHQPAFVANKDDQCDYNVMKSFFFFRGQHPAGAWPCSQ